MERVKIPCRCGQCIAGEEVEIDGVVSIFCHPKQIVLLEEEDCDFERCMLDHLLLLFKESLEK